MKLILIFWNIEWCCLKNCSNYSCNIHKAEEKKNINTAKKYDQYCFAGSGNINSLWERCILTQLGGLHEICPTVPGKDNITKAESRGKSSYDNYLWEDCCPDGNKRSSLHPVCGIKMRIEENQKDAIQSHCLQTEPSLSKNYKSHKGTKFRTCFFFYKEEKIKEQKTIFFFLERCWATKISSETYDLGCGFNCIWTSVNTKRSGKCLFNIKKNMSAITILHIVLNNIAVVLNAFRPVPWMSCRCALV